MIKTLNLKKLLGLFVFFFFCFPFYLIGNTFPNLENLLVSNTKDEAILLAQHVTLIYPNEYLYLDKKNISDEWIEDIRKIIQKDGLEKFKIFSHTGEAIFSTDQKEEGLVNKDPDFINDVKNGKIGTKLELQDPPLDQDNLKKQAIVKVFVPILVGNKFKGAYEMHYNITQKKNAFQSILERASFVFVLIAMLLLILASIISYKASKAMEQQKQSDKELYKMKKYIDVFFELTPHACISMDKFRRITRWNKKAEELTGLPFNKVKGKRCVLLRDYLCGGQCDVFSTKIQKPIVGREYSIERKDGQVRCVSKRGNLVKDHKGNILGGIEILEDITDRKNFEQHVQEKNEEVARINKLMLGRELKMKELKQKIKKLKEKNLH